jgi:hypothetical protein
VIVVVVVFRKELFAAMRAAEIEGFAVAPGVQPCRFVYLHAADGISSHSSIFPFRNGIASAIQAPMFGADPAGLCEALPQLLAGTVQAHLKIVRGDAKAGGDRTQRFAAQIQPPNEVAFDYSLFEYYTSL